MSQENVETLRRLYAALNAEVDQPLRDFLHPEFVYNSRKELPGGGAYPAVDFLDRFAELRAIFHEVLFQPEEFIVSGNDIVVAVRGTGRGRASGVPVDVRLFHVWTIQEAKARALSIYSGRAEALEAVGLSEQDAHADSP
jgi:ketosteroid isomerase-like protein